MVPGSRFSFYNPRETVYNFDRVALSVLYRVYQQYRVIPSRNTMNTPLGQSALIHFAVECEARGLELESFLNLIEYYGKGLMYDEKGLDIIL